jgi:predicted nucleotidyltransferase
MDQIALLSSTHDEGADRLLRQIVAAYEAAFPGRVRGYYVLGSYAQGTALPASDLDVAVMFADAFVDEQEMRRADALWRALDATAPVRVDGGVGDELSRPLDVRLALEGDLVQGDDGALGLAHDLVATTRTSPSRSTKPAASTREHTSSTRSSPHRTSGRPGTAYGPACHRPRDHSGSVSLTPLRIQATVPDPARCRSRLGRRDARGRLCSR